MTPREVAAEVVARVTRDDAWTRPVLDDALVRGRMEARDRALATELAYGTLRWLSPLEASLKRALDKPNRKIDRRIKPHLLVAAYQLQFLEERIPARAVIHSCVETIKRVRRPLAGFCNAVLRNMGSPAHEQLAADASLEEVCAAYGAPTHYGEGCRAVFPENWREEIAASCARPRVFVLKLKADWSPPAGARAHPLVPDCFALEAGGSPAHLEGFDQGAFTVMDPASALVAEVAAPAPESRVLDLCAAPGSKTMSLALRHGARVTAVERSASRAKRLEQNLERSGARVDVVIGDALEVDLAAAPVVVLDAPCSGFGTVRRRPEIKLRRTRADVEENAKLQSRLIARARALVAPGGTLVYAVCSPLPEEGRAHLPQLSEGMELLDERQLSTARDECDAFYIVKLRRRG